MVEAGPRLVSSFIKEELVDKLYYFIAPSLIGGNNSAFKDIGVADITAKKQLTLSFLQRLLIVMCCWFIILVKLILRGIAIDSPRQ